MPDLYIDSNATGANNGSSWADAYPSLYLAKTDATDPIATDDEVWLAHNHSKDNTGSDVVVTVPGGVKLISVNSGTNAYQAGAEEKITGSYTLSIGCNVPGGSACSIGVNFYTGESINLSSGTSSFKVMDSSVEIGSGSADFIGVSGDGANTILNEVDITMVTDTHHYIEITDGCNIVWDSGTLTGNPYYLLKSVGAGGGTAVVRNADISSLTTGDLVFVTGPTQDIFKVDFVRCKIYATISSVNTALPIQGCEVNLSSCDAGDGYHYFESHRYEGKTLENTTVYRSGGATYDGSTGFSAEFQPNSNVDAYTQPLKFKLKEIELDLTSTNTLTFHLGFGDDTSAITAFNNNEAWIEIVQNDATDNALGITKDTLPTDILTTPSTLTSSSETWTGLTHTNTDKRQIAVTTTAVTGLTNGQVTAYLCVAKYVSTLEIFACSDPVIT